MGGDVWRFLGPASKPVGLAKLATIVEFDESKKKMSLWRDGGAGQCALPGTVFDAVSSRTALFWAGPRGGKTPAPAAEYTGFVPDHKKAAYGHFFCVYGPTPVPTWSRRQGNSKYHRLKSSLKLARGPDRRVFRLK